MTALPRWNAPFSAVVLVTATLAVTGEARAEPQIEWDAPPVCPDGAAFEGQLQQHLGGSLDAADGVAIEVHVEEAKGRFALRMSLRGEAVSGERELAARRCDDVVASAAVSAALAIDPQAMLATAAAGAEGESESESESEREREGESESESEVDAEVRDERPRVAALDDERPPDPELVDLGDDGEVEAKGGGARRQLPVDIGFRIGAGGDSGSMPAGAAPEISGVVSVQWRRYRLEVGGTYVFGSTAESEIQDGRGTDITRAAASLRVCADVLRLGRGGTYGVCGGGELGRWTSVPFGYLDVEPVRATPTHLAATAGLAAAWNVRDPVRLRVDVSGASQWTPVFVHPVVEDMDGNPTEFETLFRPEVLTVRAELALELVFP